jgi:alginate O-acetyltransferase complex protein AlgJ
MRTAQLFRHSFAAFFIAVLLSGAVLAAVAVASLEERPEGSLRRGRWTAALQASFEKALPIYEPALHLWTAGRYALFREGGPGLLVGREGWLFTTEELTPAPPEEERIAESIDFVGRSVRALRERGARTAIVLLPAKARLYRDKLPTAALPEPVAARYPRALEQLREASPGIVVPDLLTAFRAARDAGVRVFLRTDTHWSPVGAAYAARHVAARLVEAGELPAMERREFETRREDSVAHRGDLLRFLPLGPFQEALGPPPDRISPRVTRPAAAASADALFADPAVPVTLVGTSYSAGELWNFRGALAEALRADVLSVAEAGRGPFTPMQDYLESETISDQPPALVIWEIPERYLVSPP